MSVNFEELDFRPTAMGLLSLRRRRHLTSGVDIYEIKLGDEFPMSSAFTVAEIALARLGMAALERADLDVVVGGLGLGYTASAVLENPGVRSLIVVDALAEVIDWHELGLLPLGKQLTGDPRCRFVNGDFFAMSHSRIRPHVSRRSTICVEIAMQATLSASGLRRICLSRRQPSRRRRQPIDDLAMGERGPRPQLAPANRPCDAYEPKKKGSGAL
jgi:hypothetical protein